MRKNEEDGSCGQFTRAAEGVLPEELDIREVAEEILEHLVLPQLSDLLLRLLKGLLLPELERMLLEPLLPEGRYQNRTGRSREDDCCHRYGQQLLSLLQVPFHLLLVPGKIEKDSA